MLPAVDALLAQVGILYGARVVIEDFASDDSGDFGCCQVLPDGTPLVRWNCLNDLMNETVAHELFHLELRHKGFPVFVLKKPEGSPIDLYPIREGFYQLHDSILHILFSEKMKVIGLDPFAYIKRGLTRALESDDLGNGMGPLGRSLYFMRAELECDDPGLLERVCDWYQDRQWDADLGKGRQLARLIRSAEVDTPEKEALTLETAANLLYNGQYSFHFIEWKEQSKGQQHIERQVFFAVEEAAR